jgi:hypothetical protein
VNALAEFLSREAGQRRREWLDQQAAGVANALSYYLGPELSQSGGRVVNALAYMNPVQDVGDAMAAGRDGRYVDMLTNTASAVAPVIGGYAAKRVNPQMVDDAAQWLQDAVMGFSVNPTRAGLSDAGRNWLADEYGGIRAYHGSPHDFDRFSMDKIGAGEGAQAYGHGLYFAQDEGIARHYRDALAPGMGDGALRAMGISDSDLRSMRQFTQSSVDPDIALRDWLGWTGKRETPELREAFMREWNGRNQGHMYEVNINADPADFLDWDKPLSEQPQAVRDALGPRVDALRKAGAGIPQDPTGDALWRVAHPQGGFDKTDFSRGVPEQAAGRLREAGIPGIKYLDAGSRGAGDGSRNFVVFDENLVEIVKKYGVAGAAAMLGVSAADVQSAMGGDQY